MKWVLIIVGGLIAVVAVIAIVGMMLPKEHVASRSVDLSAPPERVWTLITDIEGFPTWHPDVVRVERLPDRNGHTVWREFAKNGGMSYEMMELRSPSRMVAKIVDETQFGGTWTYDVVPAGTGTKITITENGEVYKPVFRTLARFVFGYNSTMDAYLAALKKKLSP